METEKLTQAETKSLRKEIKLGIVALIASAISLIGFVNVLPAQAAQVWIGEFENCQNYAACRNLGPGDVLNIDLYDGWLGGIDPGTRCADMGGILGTRSGYGWVCRSVDF